jgi:hypothetical protein
MADDTAEQALAEPVSDVFKTPHSSERNRQIARDGLILLTEVGSTMHGVTAAADDDVDEMGICIEPPDHVIGLSTFEQYEYRTQPQGLRSGAGDIDRVVYSLRKYVKLAAQGNPTVLMALFTADEHLRYINEVGHDLRTNRKIFLSRQAGRRFLGYLDGQRKKLTGELSARTKRAELVERYGYDTKYAYHALRLAIQGAQLLTDERIELPMLKAHREFLLGVRQGQLKTLDEALAVLDDLVEQLHIAAENSRLPEYPDYDKVNTWLVGAYQNWWTHAPTGQL